MSRPRRNPKPRHPDDFIMTSMRLKVRVHREITKLAEQHGRSFNSEVQKLLAISLAHPEHVAEAAE